MLRGDLTSFCGLLQAVKGPLLGPGYFPLLFLLSPKAEVVCFGGNCPGMLMRQLHGDFSTA